MPDVPNRANSTKPNDVEIVDDDDSARELLGRLLSERPVAGFDTETIGVDPGEESPVGRGTAVCFSIAIPDASLGTRRLTGGIETPVARRYFLWGRYLELFRPWLESADHPKVGDGILGFDRHILTNHGIELRGVSCDNLRLSRLLNAHSQTHDLKGFMERVLGYQVTSYRDTFRKRVCLEEEDLGEAKRRKRTVDGVKLDALVGGPSSRLGAGFQVIDVQRYAELNPERVHQVYSYASLDAKGSAERFCYQRAIAQRTVWHGLGQPRPWGNLWQFYERIWNPFCVLLGDIERTGIRYDDSSVAAGRLAARARVAELERAVQGHAGDPDYNPGSGPQTVTWLYERESLPVPPVCGGRTALKKTKPGKQPQDEAALLWLKANGHLPEAVQALLDYRKEARQLQFLEKLPGHVLTSTGRIHTVLGPEAATGRLTSKNPNLQQIPKRYDPYGIRRAFVPDPGNLFVVADYSQLEMVILAHFLRFIFGDDSLAHDIETGDTHAATATRLGLSRAVAKEINYGINYGKSDLGLSLSLGISQTAAKALLDAHATGYPGIRKFQEYCFSQARSTGVVRTLGGRYRPLPEARSEERWARGKAFRQSANTPIQGSAADIVVAAMLRLSRELSVYRGWRIVLQVHDELILEGPGETADLVLALTKLAMENPFTRADFLSIPLKVDAKIASSWLEGH